MKQKLSILEIHAAHACNLTCESCSHFSNGGHGGVLSLGDFIAEVRPWADRLEPESFRILGGEPTLNISLAFLIIEAREMFPATQLILTTNGFYLENHPSLAWALKDADCHLTISIHGNTEKYNERVYAARRWVSENEIKKVSWIPFDNSGWTRRHMGTGANVMPFEDNNQRASWEVCPGKLCRQLFVGRLWKCSPLAYIHLQKKKHPNLSNKWDSFLAHPSLAPACSDESLAEFLAREDEVCCGACPAKLVSFIKPSPLRDGRALR